ncbi:probable RNA-binding protein 19 [Cylas formicarius]|uniref:probable RNA-binding protein 19 n=1 Tax=Cylas formicarius TaxID=197179 RepID=UPI00295840C9|nr:probable RNA-binding protein 19 [Cylas formicarius]
MSRLIVKNLPKNTTEEKIRQVFIEFGHITDVQLKYTPQGHFRRFGFVGYQNEAEADEAVKKLHKSFINTSRITVEKCALLGDFEKPKSWSKYASDSTAFKKAHNIAEESDTNSRISKSKEKEKKTKIDPKVELLQKYQDDPLFEEFLEVHGGFEDLKKLKENSLEESHNSIVQSDNAHQSDIEDTEKLSFKPISDMEYMKSLIKGQNQLPEDQRKPRQKTEKKIKEKVKLFTLKLKDLPYKTSKKDIKDLFRPNIPFSIRIPRHVNGIAFVGYKTEKNFKKALLKHKSFVKGKQVCVMRYEAKDPDREVSTDPKRNRWKSQEEALKNEEDIGESGRIFVRNLSYTTTETDIEQLFSKYGPLTEVNLPVDSATRKMKGFGMVTFMMPEHAAKAYSELDGSVLHGRMLHLLPGKARDGGAVGDEETDFKKSKATKQKSEAGSAHNWNPLFLGHDAVAGVIADTYNTAKENIVGEDARGSSAAVKLALGETKLVAETRKYLEKYGVVLDAFNAPPKANSKTAILVKNLPSKTQVAEIRKLFERHGSLGRVILPPSGITAIVEFIEPSEARNAYRALAYSRFKNAPLYLQWAPEDGLSDRVLEPAAPVGDVADTTDVAPVKEEQNAEVDEEPEPDTTIFVKNLNFETRDDALSKHFSGCGKLHYATVATKRDKNNPGKKQSMGYGFVRFLLKSSADKALKTLQQSVLDGKSLELKRSERTLANDTRPSRKPTKLTEQTGSKILVRNVPFQANRKELYELFGTFGEIKALRLPKKTTPGAANEHRGFAFVDYAANSDAKAAFEALGGSTHLYGRRLVLEWASGDQGVEEIRKRTSEHFGTRDDVKSKKSVFSID